MASWMYEHLQSSGVWCDDLNNSNAVSLLCLCHPNIWILPFGQQDNLAKESDLKSERIY